MSAPYENRGSSTRRRGVITHWVPLVLTLTIATAGVAAWAWSQRTRDDDYEDDEDEYGGRPSGVPQPPFQPQQQQVPPPPPGQQQDVDYEYGDYGENPPYGATGARSAAGVSAVSGAPSGASWGARMSGALGRASSPQQWVGNASKAVTAGFTAASAAVGGALASIREGDRDAYADHETWSEEIDARRARPAASASPAPAAAAPPASSSVAGRKRKTVAIVVSAEHYVDGTDEDGFHEHASILSFIPRQTDLSKTRIFVLIYAPSLKDGQTLEAPDVPGTLQTANSLSSSFSNIAAEGAAAAAGAASSPKQEAVAPPPTSANVSYTALHTQARSLVEKDTEIIPFTTPNGYAHVLHLLEPDVVYVQESLTGDNGAIVNQLQNWMRNDIVVVVGAESGHGGLADSESEAEKPGEGAAAAPKWWQREERVGRGRGVVVVDGMRVNDDWIRRVQGKD